MQRIPSISPRHPLMPAFQAASSPMGGSAGGGGFSTPRSAKEVFKSVKSAGSKVLKTLNPFASESQDDGMMDPDMLKALMASMIDIKGDQRPPIGANGKPVRREAPTINFDAPIIASCDEKTLLLKMMKELRAESSFCDVAFLCQGVLFRAHRVIVSGWSRWLRALLSDGHDEEVVSLDVFHPEALRAVLDYMYGDELFINLKNAEDIIQVVRRLEMLHLENQIWRYLMGILDFDNCEFLHDLADRYDCPALKLAAWRKMMQKRTGYFEGNGLFPDGFDDPLNNAGRGNGFCGPGENPYPVGDYTKYYFEDDEDEDFGLSLFDVSNYERSRSPDADGDDMTDADDGDYDDEMGYYPNRGDRRGDGMGAGKGTDEHLYPRDLPPTATAAEVVKSWAYYLKDVHDSCIYDPSLDDLENLEIVEQPIDPNAVSEAARGAVPEDGRKKTFRRKLDWEKELKKFYLVINRPDKLSDVRMILENWVGTEREMLEGLLDKYGDELPQIAKKRLNRIIDLIDMGEIGPYIPRPETRN